jgi:hypothetical protein
MLCTARVAPEKAVFRPVLPLHFVQPEFTGEPMEKMTYKEQLAHPKWQRKRLETLEAANWACETCGTTDKTLHVHHKKYVKGRKAWEYERNELAALCEDCHDGEHRAQEDFENLLQRVWQGDTPARGIAHGFLAGFLLPFDRELQDVAVRAFHLPFFDIGYMVAALGPTDIEAAVRRKIEEGRLPDSEFIRTVLGEGA